MGEDTTERSLVMLKPDAVQRQLVGRIVARFEAKGLKITAMKMCRLSRDQARKQYAAHQGKYFYKPLLDFMTAGPVVIMVLEGKGAVAVTRSMMGPTFGPDAPAGTIRGDFAMSKRFNLIHGSDSPEVAEEEVAMFFVDQELCKYELHAVPWVYDTSGGEVI